MRYRARLGNVTPFEMPGMRTPNVPAVDVENVSPDNPTDMLLGGLGDGEGNTTSMRNWPWLSDAPILPLLAVGGLFWLLSKKRRR